LETKYLGLPLLTLLTALTKKNVKSEWTTEHQEALESLKNSLTHEVVLTYPDFATPFKIYNGPSKYQIRSVTTQKDKPLAFYSRKITNPQMRYTSHHRTQTACNSGNTVSTSVFSLDI
jgi:hypothetical protein